MKSASIVVEREIREATRRRSFWVVIAVLAASSTAAMVLPELLDSDEGSFDVAVVGEQPAFEEAMVALAAAVDHPLALTTVEDLDAARDAVEDDRADVGVEVADPSTIVALAEQDQQLVGLVQQALATIAVQDQLATAGLSPEEAAAVLDVAPATVDELQEDEAGRRGVAAVLSILLYLLLFVLMMQVANGVAVEKANRISEVLLAIVRPGPLLYGKVIGVGLLGLFTLAVGMVPVIAKIVAGGDLPDGLVAGLATGAAFYVVGVALYLVLAGALGALVERQEEAGSAVAPLSVVLIGSYLVANAAPDSAIAAVLAYIPLSAPLVMPSRVAADASSTFEVVASLLLSIVAVVVVGRWGATVYKRAVVRTGRRLKLREVLRSPA